MSTVTVTDKKYAVDPLFQWDQGQVLEIRGLSLAKAPEIHFDNGCLSGCVVKQATMDNAGIIYVNIPNILLQKPHKITAYVCDCGEEVFRSLYAFEIPVKPRKKPEFYEVVDEYEIYSIEALKTEVEIELQKILDTYNLVDTSVENAKTSELNAKASEDKAKESELNAKDSEENTKTIEERAREVFESIPEDYSTISNDLYELAIKETASGEEIHVNDSSNLKLREFALYGKAEQQTTQGNQLFNGVFIKGNVDSSSGTFVSQGIDGDRFTTDYIKVKPNTAHIWNDDLWGYLGGHINVFTRLFDENKNIMTNASTSLVKNGVSFVVPDGVHYLRLIYTSEDFRGLETFKYKVMLNEGTTALPWEEFSGGQPSPNPQYPQPIEVSGASGSVEVKSCGKNYIDYPTTDVNKNFWLVGDFPISGSTSHQAKKIFLQKGTYTFSIKSNVNTKNAIAFHLYDSDGVKITTYTIASEKGYSVLTFTVDKNVHAVSSFATITDTFSEIQIEKGNQRTPYEPYKETLATIPTPNGLASVNDARDVIVKYADGSGEHIQRVKNILLDGVNNKMQKSSSGTHYFIKLSDAMKIVTENQSTLVGVISDRYIARTWLGVSLDSIKKTGIALMWGNGIGIYDSNYANSSETDFNAFLAENPVNVYYLLAEPIVTPLTAEEIAEIEKLHTFNPITNISNDFDCGMSVTYYVDNKIYIDNQIASKMDALREEMANMFSLMPASVQATMIENDTNNLLTESEE